MKLKVIHYIKEIAFFFIVLTIFANLMSLYKSSNLNNTPLTISSVDLLDKKSFLFNRDKPILLHFWATWCPTCKLEASNIDRIAQDFQVVTIAVKSGSDKEIQDFLDTHSLNFMVLNDRDASFAHSFKISAYPTTFIYNKNRELVFSDVGYTSTWGLWLRMWWAGL